MSLSSRRRSLQRFVLRKQHFTGSGIRQISNSGRNPLAQHADQEAPIRSVSWPPAGYTKPSPREKIPLNSASLPLDGTNYTVGPLILRDLCTCPRCVDPSTRQKHFCTTEIPAEIRVKHWEAQPDKFLIKWDNDIPGLDGDHLTEIPKDVLRRLFENGASETVQIPLPRALWDAKSYTTEAKDFKYEEYMKDDSVLLQALRQLHTHGLLFVTNVPEDGKSVEDVAERIGPLKTTFYGRTWDVRSVPDAINVAYTAQNLGFHMDLMYMEQPPHLQLLHCIRSSAAGGASLFTDSFRAVDDLATEDEEALHQLTLKKVTFHYDHPGSHYYRQLRPVINQKQLRIGNFRAPTYWDLQRSKQQGKGRFDWVQLKPMDFVDHVSWAPPFQGPFALKSPADTSYLAGKLLSTYVSDWHHAAQKFNRLIHRPEMIYERMMKPGECVIFDNRRVLHARKAFEVGDAGKERWLKGAYIDKDPYMSRLRVLREQLGDRAMYTEENSGDQYFKESQSSWEQGSA